MLETAGLLAASFGAWSLVYAPRSCDKLVFEAMDGVRALPEGRESTAGGKMVRSRASEWSVRACSSLCASVLCKRVNRQLREMSTLPSRRLLTLSMHAGMQFAGGLTEQTATASSLKRRERSPSPRPCKRRVPSYYSPQLYADAPPSLARGWSFDANGGRDDTAGAPSSERSSPGLDWLRRTQELHLATPPLGGQHSLAGTGSNSSATAMDANGDVGMDGETEGALPHEQHLASTSNLDSHHSAAGHLYHPIPVAPHHAPPLHQHLAGSPQEHPPPPPSRPPSATSVGAGAAHPQSQLGAASFGLAGPIDWSQQQQPDSVLLDAEDSAMMMDDSAAGARKQTGGTGGGGWKVTMGYRADCIKCLQRVPGHYSHVVPT